MIKHVVSVSGGKDSAATLLIALEKCQMDSVIPIFCDTGNEHQSVFVSIFLGMSTYQEKIDSDCQKTGYYYPQSYKLLCEKIEK